MVGGLRVPLVGKAIRALLHPDGMEERAFRRAFEAEARESNARVVLWAACVLVPLRMLAVIALLRRVETEPARAVWLAVTVRVHALEAVILFLAGVVAWRGRPGALWRVLGDVVAPTALLGAAAMSANAQRANPNLNVFIIAAVCIALFLREVRDASGVGGLTAGQILGTPEFLSPEQINAPRRVDAPADVYALGLVLYLCLAGRMPFEPGSTKSWLLMHLALPPAELSSYVPDLDPTLSLAVMACLDKDPDARPSAAAMAATLARLADDARTPPLEALDLVRCAQEVSSAATLTLPEDAAALLTRETLPGGARTKC